MKKHKKDEISDSSDNPDDDLEPLEENGTHLETSNRQHSSIPSDSDSDSEKRLGDDEDSTSRLDSGEPPQQITQVQATGEQKSVSVQSIFNFEDLTSDDEIYTLQCPSEFKKQDLLNKSIDFTKPNQTEEFQFELINSERKFITLAVPRKSGSGTLINVPLKGHIIVQKVINMPTNDLVIEDVCKNNEVVFPQDIKIRHPLLGVDWEDHIKIAKKAIEKSNSFKKKSIEKEKELEIKQEHKPLKRKVHESEPSVHKKRKKM